MTAPKTFLYLWEKQNEELLLFILEKSFSLTKIFSKKLFLILNILAFIFYKLVFFAGLTLRTALLTPPTIRPERDEIYLFRQVR